MGEIKKIAELFNKKKLTNQTREVRLVAKAVLEELLGNEVDLKQIRLKGQNLMVDIGSSGKHQLSLHEDKIKSAVKERSGFSLKRVI